MFKRIAPFDALSLLSDCEITNGDEYHNATLSAFQSSEANMTTKMTNLETQMGIKNEYIESLEKQHTEQKTKVGKINIPTPNITQQIPTKNHPNTQTPTTHT
ncbi:ATP-dependent Zn protease, partial [Vibrio cholerae]|nr:ATP-dependent Zn protease [Vibrio cholerae]